jgi:hypothetical protein
MLFLRQKQRGGGLVSSRPLAGRTPVFTQGSLFTQGSHGFLGSVDSGGSGFRAPRCAPLPTLRAWLRLVLPKKRGHPGDLKRKVEKDRKDRAGD